MTLKYLLNKMAIWSSSSVIAFVTGWVVFIVRNYNLFHYSDKK